MKLNHENRRWYLFFALLLILIITGCSVFIYLSNNGEHGSASKTTGTSSSKTLPADKPETTGPRQSNHIPDQNNTPLDQPEPSPSILITNLSTTTSTGKISYTATIEGAAASQTCTLTVADSNNKKFSVTTASTPKGCSGEIKNDAFKPGTSWTITLLYKTKNLDSVARKTVTI